jgi:general secretion pathway protein C
LTIDSLCRKHFPLVVCTLLALSAYFVASGASQLVGAVFIPPAVSASSTGAQLAAPRVVRRTTNAVIERNPFDSVTGSLNAKAIETTSPGPKHTALVTKDPLQAEACEGITASITTESTDRLWSVATLQSRGEPRPRMRRVGAEIAGKRVEYIGFNPLENSPSVWLSDGAALCQALLFQAAPPPTTLAITATPGAEKTLTRGARSVPAEIASKIQRISDTEFHLDRAVIDDILDHQAELMQSVRIVPASPEGNVTGFRLFGIRAGTLLGTLGMRDGDRLESINGFSLASPERALEAYARLRTATSLNVQLSRQGRPLTIDYQIQ